MKMEFGTSRKMFYIVLTFFICLFSFNQYKASAAPRTGVTGDPKPFSLPLVLLSYDISMNNRKVFMNWVTGQEKKISHFVIERSTNGADYVEAGVVVAIGNSDAKTTYTYSEDLNTQANVVYYRLRMIDMYGHYQNSEVRLIRAGAEVNTSLQLQIFPNPAVNQVALTVPAKWQSKHVEFYVYNVNGHVVKHVMSVRNNQTSVVDLQGLERGVYVVRASTDSESLTQRIMKM